MVSCSAGSGEGLDDQGVPQSEDNGQITTPIEASDMTLASLQEQVLTPICSQCHFGSNAPLGLQMDSIENSEANLINVPSVTNSEFLRVAPGDPDNSFFYLKIVGDPIAGNRMPLGLPPLEDSVISDIYNWIERGAPINSEQLNVANVTVQNSITSSQITLQFSQVIEQQSLPIEGIRWFYLEQGKQTEFSPEVSVFTWLNESKLVIEISRTNNKALAFELNGTNSTSVISKHGVMLDGNENGKPGGAYYYETQI